MKKDFINFTPNGEGGSNQNDIIADPNPGFSSRSTTLNFSSRGGGGN